MIFQSLIANGSFKILGGLYLGWGIGANDSANIFGTAVATNVIRFRTAIILIAIFVIIGSMVEGPGLYENMTFSQESSTKNLALAATLAAALTVTLITFLSIPTSTSQAAVGAFMGIAIAASGSGAVEWSKFITMLTCWLINPIGCIIICVILLKCVGILISKTVKNRLTRDRIYKYGLIIFGCYGAYALGANNVVVTTAPYYHAGMFGPAGSKAAFWAATLGGISIAIGALTYSRRVMATIGKKITPLSPFSALIVVMTHALALHFFTWLKIPVSSSQAVVGAVIAVGLYHGANTINKKTMAKILAGWLITPLISGLLAFGLFYILGT
jgi:inorganic phosphate transporter, PiT family